MAKVEDTRITVTVSGSNADEVTRRARQVRDTFDWLAPDMSIGKVGNLHTVTLVERSALEQVKNKDGRVGG